MVRVEEREPGRKEGGGDGGREGRGGNEIGTGSNKLLMSVQLYERM